MLSVIALVVSASAAYGQDANTSEPPQTKPFSRAIYAGFGNFGIPASLNYEQVWRNSALPFPQQFRALGGIGYWYEGQLDVVEEYVYALAGGSYAVGQTLQAEIGGTVMLEGSRSEYLSITDTDLDFRFRLRPFVGARYEGRRLGLRVSLAYAPVGEDEISPWANDFVPGIGVGYRF
jgi:hypothetical protein